MSFPDVPFQDLPPNTIVPSPTEQEDIFIQYLNRVYEDIAYIVNQKDFNFFQITITDTEIDIPFMNRSGAYIIAISGEFPIEEDLGTNYLPSGTWAVAKSSEEAAAAISNLQLQSGVGPTWLGQSLQLTSSATNLQINHTLANAEASFNIRIIGTQ